MKASCHCTSYLHAWCLLIQSPIPWSRMLVSEFACIILHDSSYGLCRQAAKAKSTHPLGTVRMELATLDDFPFSNSWQKKSHETTRELWQSPWNPTKWFPEIGDTLNHHPHFHGIFPFTKPLQRAGGTPMTMETSKWVVPPKSQSPGLYPPEMPMILKLVAPEPCPCNKVVVTGLGAEQILGKKHGLHMKDC